MFAVNVNARSTGNALFTLAAKMKIIELRETKMRSGTASCSQGHKDKIQALLAALT